MKIVMLVASALLMVGCNVAKYQPYNWYSGGYADQEISESSFRIDFHGNQTDLLTIQTYWLLRASELTLERGFDGFEIVDPAPTDRAPSSTGWLRTSYRVRCPDLNLVCTQHSRTPGMEAFATIRLIREPVNTIPLKVFDAHVLKASLDPIVKGKNCGGLGTSKVCPHDKSYLFSK